MHMHQGLILSILVPIILLLCPSPLSLVPPDTSMTSLLSSIRSIVSSRLVLSSSSSSSSRILLGRSTMSTFTLPSTSTTVHLTPDLTQSQLMGFRPFTDWLSKLQHSLSLQSQNPHHPFHSDPYALNSITIQSVDFFGNSRIGFLKLKAAIQSSSGATLPGSVFLRGGSVAILFILETTATPRERWAVLTVQPRIPAGSLEMVELPAGMIDDSGTFAGAAAKEIQEECGIEIPENKLIDLTSRVLGPLAKTEDERLEEAVYPSPGGSDEFMKIYAYVHQVEEGALEEWRGRLTGLRDQGEKITLKLVRLEDLWRETRDAKALSAMALWTGLGM